MKAVVRVPNILSFSHKQLTDWFLSNGAESYRSSQVFDWMYKKGANSFAEMSNIPVSLQETLQRSFAYGSLSIAKESTSNDGTVKRLYKLFDNYVIETVHMTYRDDRQTVCVSSQAGCAMNCSFCATGQQGFKRQLRSAEIFEQVWNFHRQLVRTNDRCTNIVFMGMGEPLANLQNVLPAISLISSNLDMSPRRITVSTVGLAPQILELAKETSPPVRLAISLHASTDEKRSEIVPINKKYPIKEVLGACREYIAATGRRVSFEYALIEGVNDTKEEAISLAQVLKAHGLPMMLCHVNVIPLNPTSAFVGRGSSKERVAEFTRELTRRTGMDVTVRVKRGIDIAAGCGQLAGTRGDELRKGSVVPTQPVVPTPVVEEKPEEERLPVQSRRRNPLAPVNSCDARFL